MTRFNHNVIKLIIVQQTVPGEKCFGRILRLSNGATFANARYTYDWHVFKAIPFKDRKLTMRAVTTLRLTKIVVRLLLPTLCAIICPGRRSNPWKFGTECLQCHETNVNMTTMSINSANESLMASEITADRLPWRLGQFINSNTSNALHCRVQRTL